MIDIYLLFVCVLFISLNVFFKKMIIKHVSLEEYMIVITIFIPIIITSYFIIKYGLIGKKKLSFKFLKKLSLKILFLFLLTAIVTVTSNLILVELLKRKNVSYLMPHIVGLSLIFSTILAYFIFKEEINFSMCLGIILVILGIFIINCSKNK